MNAPSPSPGAEIPASETPLARRLGRRASLEAVVVPDLRQRLRLCTQISAIAFTVYTAASYFFGGENADARLALNVFRVVGLAACLWALRGDGSHRHTLAMALTATSITFVVGAMISVLRADASPMVVLTITSCAVMAILLPWGLLGQTIYVIGVSAALAIVHAIVGPQAFSGLSVDGFASLAIALCLSIGVASFMESMRRASIELLRDARQADEELTRFHAMLEDRVSERTAALEFANREIEGFSFTVSHDLRSPLRTIAGFTNMIAEDNEGRLSETSLDSLARIRAAARRMDSLIDDMLVLARVGRSALRLEPVHLAAIARSIEGDLRAEDPGREVEFEVDRIPVVRGDHALLHIAMDNLLRNAWKFTSGRERASIRVSGELDADRVVCRVADNGIGFDPRFRDKLFRPFERLHDDPDFDGTGVGLATVARVVHRHGGEVDAAGRPGEGATFTFRLPKDGSAARLDEAAIGGATDAVRRRNAAVKA
jgi:signal transduction histidine kinase